VVISPRRELLTDQSSLFKRRRRCYSAETTPTGRFLSPPSTALTTTPFHPLAMAAARACLVALVVAAALFLEAGAAANAARSAAQQRQLLRQRKVHSHLRRLNKVPVASIEVLLAHLPCLPVRFLLPINHGASSLASLLLKDFVRFFHCNARMNYNPWKK
jgi:hypothetical protein